MKPNGTQEPQTVIERKESHIEDAVLSSLCSKYLAGRVHTGKDRRSSVCSKVFCNWWEVQRKQRSKGIDSDQNSENHSLLMDKHPVEQAWPKVGWLRPKILSQFQGSSRQGKTNYSLGRIQWIPRWERLKVYQVLSKLKTHQYFKTMNAIILEEPTYQCAELPRAASPHPSLLSIPPQIFIHFVPSFPYPPPFFLPAGILVHNKQGTVIQTSEMLWHGSKNGENCTCSGFYNNVTLRFKMIQIVIKSLFILCHGFMKSVLEKVHIQ